MKKILVFIILLFFIPTLAFGGYVRGHFRSNGTYVRGYHRTNRNHIKLDNYSTKGNINPYTGKKGYKRPY